MPSDEHREYDGHGQGRRIDELERDMSDVKSRLAITEERSRRVEELMTNMSAKLDHVNKNLEHYIRDVERWKGGRDATLKVVSWTLGGGGVLGAAAFAYTLLQ